MGHSRNTALLDTHYYEVATPDSLAERIAGRARDRIFSDFMRIAAPLPDDIILDVGVSDVVDGCANVLERRYPYPGQITAAGLGRAEQFQLRFPQIRYRQILPNQPLPFADRFFDVATSNAVLEHVGSVQNQRRFLAELCRVAERVFVTVPNRFFPVEHHTGIPLLHWADGTFAHACRLAGKRKWAERENLILMSRRRLAQLCPPDREVRLGYTGILLGRLSGNVYCLLERRRR